MGGGVNFTRRRRADGRGRERPDAAGARRLAVRSLFAAGAVVAALLASASAQEIYRYPDFGIRDVTVEGVILGRGDLGGAPLTKANNANGSLPGGATSFVPVSTAGLDPGTGTGVRVSVEGWLFGRPIRYSFLGAWDFEDSFTRTGLSDGALGTDAAYELPGADVDLDNSDEIEAIRVDHQSRLTTGDSATYPMLFPGSEDVRVLFGTRLIMMNEELSTAVFNDANDFAGLDNEIDRANVEVDNRMIGLQVGVEGEQPVSEGVTVGGFVKGGLLANFIDVETSFASDDAPANALNKGYDDIGFAQFIEASGNVSVRLTESASLVASGMLLWVNGVNEAGDNYSQVSDAQATGIGNDEDAVFYGARLGVKIDLN